MEYQKWNNTLGWLCALLATTVYFLTKEPTVSYWDCGEFIASAYKLQIVHQPGAPLFLMIQNIFSNLALRDTHRLAYWMNAGSALCSGLTILFLFWTITALAKKAFKALPSSNSINQNTLIFGAGIVGALAYAFSDTFWFSAVETEVYAMSSLCTALVFWLILKWELQASAYRSEKWLVLIAFIMGLSIGVHLLNLLTIPVLGLVIYFKQNPKYTIKGIVQTLLVSFIILASILWGIIQYLVKMAAQFDYFFVNQLKLGFGSGILFFVLLLVSTVIYGLYYSVKRGKIMLNLALICFSFVLFGYGSFAMVVIRASANPSLNNYHPSNAFNFIEYISRSQYVANPLITGPYFDSKIIDAKEGAPIYRKDKDQYRIVDHQQDYVYDRTTFFPRIHSQKDSNFYRSWLNLGPNTPPTLINNLQFFGSYQVGVMFWRYFMWNFAGRQNDEVGQLGNATDGNWISGIPFVDQLRLPGQKALPSFSLTDPSRNTLYFLPLILGIIGLIWHYKSHKKDMIIVGLLFFFTGIAIVLYLNDTPLQPRERDYVYAGAFYAFAVWVGLSVPGLYHLLKKRLPVKLAAYTSLIVCLFAAPVLMLKEEWNDHDRSQQHTAKDLNAVNYLQSCAPNAILFTYGDNDTFPLWYAQEVEHIRPDVKVVNIGYLNSDWYVKQMKKKTNDAAGLPISIPDAKIDKGVRDYLPYEDYGIPDHVELSKLLDVILSDHPDDQSPYSHQNFLPTKKMKLTVDRATVIKTKQIPKAWESFITDSMEWEFNQSYITRGNLAVLSVLANNNWERPIYFVKMPHESLMGLDAYLFNEGLVDKLMPVNLPKATVNHAEINQAVNLEALSKNLMENFSYGNVKKLNHLDPVARGMIPEYTRNFSFLAQKLTENGQLDEARKVALKCLEVLPNRALTIDQSVDFYFLSDTLYKTGETAKANNLVKQNGEYVSQQLNYQLQIAQDYPNMADERGIRLGMGVLNAMLDNAKKFRQTELQAYLNDRYIGLEKKIE